MPRSFLTPVELNGGSTTAPPVKVASGTLISTPAAGGLEYNGTHFFLTPETSANGRNVIQNASVYYNTTSSGIGADNFYGSGSASGVTLAATSLYELEYYLPFFKTTAGTVTFAINFSAAPTLANGVLTVSPVAGGAGTASVLTSSTTTTALNFPATASVTSGATIFAVLKAYVYTNSAAVARLFVTCSAGTVSRSTNSHYTVRRIPSSSVGTFTT